LSWPNLPCVLKATIGSGKRTLGALASLRRPGGRSKALSRPLSRVENLPDEAKAPGGGKRWQTRILKQGTTPGPDCLGVFPIKGGVRCVGSPPWYAIPWRRAINARHGD